MAKIIKNILLDTNRERLTEVIRVQYPNAVFRFAEHNPTSPYIEIDDDNADEGVLTTIVENHNPAELTTEQQTQAEDISERATLLQQAAAALTQIENDETALTAAASLAAVKPIVQNMLNREERIIKALRAIIRSGLI